MNPLKKLIAGLIWLFFLSTNNVFAQKRCLTMERDSILSQRYKNWVFECKRLLDSVNTFMASPQKNARVAACDIIKIPVVVHIVHNNSSNFIGGNANSNISDAQILNQIRVLNEDFRRKTGTNGNRAPVGVDTGIEFYLAKIDPNGRPTTGITRHYTSEASFDFLTDDLKLATIVSWPSDQYLNIWVAKDINNTLGSAQFPLLSGGSIDGLNNPTKTLALTDGIYVDYRVFGTGGVATNLTYKFGRTTTHEVGHWLGLLHTWGDAFCGEDFCNDVPPAEHANQNGCGPVYSNCNGRRTLNQTENYMDYSPDSCMSVFTACQAARMRAVIEKSPRRNKIALTSCLSLPSVAEPYVEVSPNPTAGNVSVKVFVNGFDSYTIEIYDLAGRTVYSQFFGDYPSWSHNLNLQNLANGHYVVSVKLPDRRLTKKVVLMR